MAAFRSLLPHELVDVLRKVIQVVREVPGAVDAPIAVALHDGNAISASRDNVTIDLALDIVEEGELTPAKAFSPLRPW